jgi:hypothetical protein
MTDYVKATNFFVKDSLLVGNPDKIVKGSEIDTEFNNIATAVSSKANYASPNLTGIPTAPTAASGTNTSQLATTAFVKSAVDSNSASVAITGGTIDDVDITGGTIVDLDAPLAVNSGGTGKNTLALNNVLLGNGTAAVQEVAPGASGNVLKSDGTTWTSGTVNAGIGDGQTWTNVVGSRAYGTTYTNLTGRPIYVSVTGVSTVADGGGIQFYINGALVAQQGATFNDSIASFHNITMIIPNDSTYSANAIPGGGGNGGSSLQQWYELR